MCPSCGYTAQRDCKAGMIILQRALVGMGMPEVTPVETPTAGHLGAGRVSLNQEISFHAADEPSLGDSGMGSSLVLA